MSAADVAVVDLSTPATEPAVVETQTPEVELTPTTEEVKSDSEVGKETEKPEEKTDTKAEAKVEAKFEPNKVQKSLHERLQGLYKIANPEHKETLQTLNSDLKTVFKELQTAREAQGDIKELQESSSALQSLVQEADQLLYDSSDPAKATELVSNIFSDISDHSTPEAFDGFVSAAIDKWKTERPAQFYSEHVLPTYGESLQQTGAVDCVRGMIKAWNAGDQETLRSHIESLGKHVEEVGSKVAGHKEATEKASLAKQAEAVRATLISEMSLDVRKSLGAALGPVIKSTELATYPRETLVELSRFILKEAERRLDTDAAFNKTLEKLYKEKGSAAVKAENLKKINAIAKAVVDDTVKQVYPNLGKRVEKAAAPKTIEYKEGKFQVVKVKPADLDYTRKNASTLSIAGRGWRQNGTAVVWRQN